MVLRRTALLAALIALAPLSAFAQSSLDDYKVAVAKAIHAANPELIHNRQPQPLLRAVVVVRITPTETGYDVEVFRENKDEPTMTTRALDMLRRTPLVPVPADLKANLSAVGYIETWLFDTDGTSQVAKIAKPQRGE